MKHTRESPQPSAIGGPLPVLLDFRNGGRGWRMSLGAAFQAALLGLVLVLPLLVTESFTAKPQPDVHQTIRLGNPQGRPDGPRPSGEKPTIREHPRPDQVVLTPQFPHPISSSPTSAGFQDPTTGGGGGGPSWLGDRNGDPTSDSPIGTTVGRGQPQPPPPPVETILKGGDIRPPRLIHRVDPDYPRLAKIAGIQGDVVLEALLDKDGRVRNVELKSGPPILGQAARAAVQQWVYEPTYLNGQPYPVLLEVTVEFRLRH